jgi:N-formylglutamate amidohydrolase
MERLLQAGGAPLARLTERDTRVLALALHAGHLVRDEVAGLLGVSDEERMREEDPHTAEMAPEGVTLVEVLRSRFEVDLNRPRFRAVYQGPPDAWGLDVWRETPSPDQLRASRLVHDVFYEEMDAVLSRTSQRFGRFVVLDLHSYNHRRDGAAAPPADPLGNPEVNLGTKRIDRDRWSPVVDAFTRHLVAAGFEVAENTKFGGGHFAQWVTDRFPGSGCPLAIEFKKTYMDEWTGTVDTQSVARIRATLTSLLVPLERALRDVR